METRAGPLGEAGTAWVTLVVSDSTICHHLQLKSETLALQQIIKCASESNEFLEEGPLCPPCPTFRLCRVTSLEVQHLFVTAVGWEYSIYILTSLDSLLLQRF